MKMLFSRDLHRNPFAKNTFRVLNDSFKIMGILDWRFALAAAIPAVFFGLVAHSKVAGAFVFCLLAWRAWGVQEEDPDLPLVWFASVLDKFNFDAFRRGDKGNK